MRSELYLYDENTAASHTRGRTVFRPVVHLKPQPSTYQDHNEDKIIWTGKLIEISQISKAMNQASKDCINEGKKNIFRYLWTLMIQKTAQVNRFPPRYPERHIKMMMMITVMG